ncbi:MAG TPA: flagellar protein FlaG [Rhodocyclaceae bacterium]|nr:flagellar protein FlaG [Rhodocyclaceae bacterium]
MSIQAVGNTGGSVQAASAASPTQSTKHPDTSNASAATGNAQDSQPDSHQLNAALDKLKKVADASSSDLQFSVDKDSGRTIVRVVDKGTGDLIRQIPSKDVLEIAKSIESMQGMLFKKEA